MRKLLAITLALGLLLSIGLATPALAENNNNGPTTTVGTGVNVVPGDGEAPIIVAKWETPDHDPDTPGTQIDPPLVFDAEVDVEYWAIVTHIGGVERIGSVYVDVYYPTWEPWCGDLKYQLKMEKVEKFELGKPEFEEAWRRGTISLECLGTNPATDEPFTYDDIIELIDECLADIYWATDVLHYHQPYGDYTVEVRAVTENGPSSSLFNTMHYVPVSAVEVDFEELSYGTVNPLRWKDVGGDKNFDEDKATAGPILEGYTNQPTVRNIGNTHAQVTVHQSNLRDADGKELPKTNNNYNVAYRARLGTAAEGYSYHEYGPCETETLDKILPLCNTDKIDLGIKILKDGLTGVWSGDITFGAVIVEFEECNDNEPD